MARKPRIEFAGAFFHIIVRGNNRENIFRDSADYLRYLQKLVYFCRKGDMTLYAYCLMPNHIHLLLEMGKVSLSKVLQRFHTWYTQYFNRRYDRVGHVFQGRYKAIICDKDAYLLELVRYIHLNPVRAGLVDEPEDYPWSSHRIYIGEDRSEAIDPTFFLGQFSDDVFAARRFYKSFVTEGVAQGRREDLYKVSDQRILGNEAFYKQVFQRQRGEEGEFVGVPTVHFELDELKEIMEKAMGVESGFLRSGGQSGAWMRRIFCYIARAYGAHKAKDVAVYIGKDLATVTHAVRFVENLLHVGDQKAINATKRVWDQITKRRVSWREREKTLASFLGAKEETIAIAYLFGSVVRGRTGPLSDVDIAVWFRDEMELEGRYELAFQLRKLLGVESLHLVALNRAPIELKYQIIKEGRVIFSDSVMTRVEFEAKILSQYADYLPVLERQRSEILEASYGTAGVQRYREALGQTERMLKQVRAT
jgi:REP element-mobilizing transposase RayT/predicted nucleotidyltransferase